MLELIASRSDLEAVHIELTGNPSKGGGPVGSAGVEYEFEFPASKVGGGLVKSISAIAFRGRKL